MKRQIVATGILALAVGIAGQAQASRMGVHGAYSMGGDIEESEVGFGGQLELSLNPMFSIELAVSRYGDELDEDGILLEQDLTSIGLSAVFRAPLGPQLQGYALVGANYNIVDMDVDIEPQNGINFTGEVDTDDATGFHAGGGINFALPNNWDLFIEYRYTILELEGEVSVSALGVTSSDQIEGDNDFGLLKVGLNYLF
ncbi:MAG: porin family protein [Candidatus Electrothrix sp. ATG2]|nr:porin family protein [Candidatus Electrothrix sp. ATG2]